MHMQDSHGKLKSTSVVTNTHDQCRILLSLVPRPKEEEEKGPGFSRSHMRLIAVELPPSHTLDIPPYTCDANIDTKSYTVSRFITATNALARDSLDCTHPAADLKL